MKEELIKEIQNISDRINILTNNIAVYKANNDFEAAMKADIRRSTLKAVHERISDLLNKY